MTDDLKARGVRAEKRRRNALAHHEQQAEAEASCVPCKLCGGKAVVRDAGPGWGYYIECENAFDSMARGRGYCLQSGVRLSGWAYNCSDMWNRLNATPEALADHPTVKALVAEGEARGMERAAKRLDARIQSLVADHGSHEWDTNVTNLPEWVETATEELEEQATAIRAKAAAIRKETT